MKVLKILIVMLVLIMSVGAVCAADTLSDDTTGGGSSDTLAAAPENVYAVGDGSFSDLKNEIGNATDVLDLSRDYVFNNGTDESKGITITDQNLTINGNGHKIDANNMSRIFIFDGGNVILNNLTLINANRDLGSVFGISNGACVTTKDVTIKDCVADTGVIYIQGGAYYSNNDKILDSTSTEAGVIKIVSGYLELDNAFMMSSKDLTGGFIYTEDSPITVSNSIFANTTSKYTAAIRGAGRLIVRNSDFINLKSDITAGAIGIKEIDEFVVDNCRFINVTSNKNGGAIFSDVVGYTHSNIGAVLINATSFVNCSSGFGGAILHLGGNITIADSNFTDNSALFDGGAVYISSATVLISGSTFTENSAIYPEERGSFGGAVFCDLGLFEITDSKFENNSAQVGSGVYLYDSSYYIANTQFKESVNFDGSYGDIFTVFDGITTILDNTNVYSGDDSVSQNNTDYATICVSEGMKLNLINNTIDVSSLPSKFDLRDWGWLTPVKAQGRMGSCWTFGSSGAMESSILRFLGIEMDLSENNMQDVSLMYYKFGIKEANEGNIIEASANYALSWLGVFSGEYDVYDELGKISPLFAVNNSIHIQDVVILAPRHNLTDNDGIKEAIIKYGGVLIDYFADSRGTEQYYNGSYSINHGVVAVGWDDDREIAGAPGKGAWIIKNSWGEAAGEKGFMYISYYDTSFSTVTATYAFLLENTVPYNKNYQYDMQGLFGFNNSISEYRNNFIALDDDLIGAVGTYFDAIDVNYTVEIFVNDDLKLVQSGLSPFRGFHTIKLDTYVPVKKGDEFTVKVKSNAVPMLAYSRQHYITGSSQVLINGVWTNITDDGVVCCLKAYTVADDTKIVDNKDISVDYDGGKYFTVKVVTDDGHAVGAGETVKFTINGKTTTVKTDSNGIAKIKITDVPKTYTIKTTYKGKTVTNKVTVKQVLTTSKVTVKKTAKSFALQAKLKINGKLVKGKQIIFKFNGKTYKAKTNSKGVAKVTLKKNVINKLKKGKTYTVKITYSKDTIKSTVKVQ